MQSLRHSVDSTDSGEETFLHRSEDIDHLPGRLAIDGSGTASAGTMYIFGRADGSIARLTYFELWAPSAPQRDGLAADDEGNLYALVRGTDDWSAGPIYTGLVRFDGTGWKTIVHDSLSSPGFNTETGDQLEAVVVSTTAGLLTGGHPVVLRRVFDGGSFPFSLDIVSVNPDTGEETFLPV